MKIKTVWAMAFLIAVLIAGIAFYVTIINYKPPPCNTQLIATKEYVKEYPNQTSEYPQVLVDTSYVLVNCQTTIVKTTSLVPSTPAPLSTKTLTGNITVTCTIKDWGVCQG